MASRLLCGHFGEQGNGRRLVTGKLEPPFNAWWCSLPDLDGIPLRFWGQTPAIIAMSERKPEFIQQLVELFVDVEKVVGPILDPR